MDKATVTTQRRMGVDGAKNREVLVDAAAHLLVTEGYAAITARRVAERAGLKVQLVYYYFQSMDELIVAVIRRNSARRIELLEEVAASAEPLRALWELNSDPNAAITQAELLSLANHRESIRNEVALHGKELRRLQIELVARLMTERGIDQSLYPAGAVVTIIAAIARARAQDCALGVSEGYDEAVEFIERGLNLFIAPTKA
ncbi:MAG: TetR/AcrR family transcriptional regulator [Sphingobium sp.]